jgi:phage regulator Rha-like protein
MNTSQIKLVEVHGNELTTTSLVIAELFGRPHKNVLQSLDKIANKNSGLVFKLGTFEDKNGDERRMIILNERSFLIAMPFIGGNKSFEGQVKLVDEFLRLQKIINSPNRHHELQYKRDTAKPMTDMLKFLRESSDKETNKNHYVNEHKFCNRALTGNWEPVYESSLDNYDVKLLGAIRSHNTLLMTRHLKQSDRRDLLDKFVCEYRLKNPRLALVD